MSPYKPQSVVSSRPPRNITNEHRVSATHCVGQVEYSSTVPYPSNVLRLADAQLSCNLENVFCSCGVAQASNVHVVFLRHTPEFCMRVLCGPVYPLTNVFFPQNFMAWYFFDYCFWDISVLEISNLSGENRSNCGTNSRKAR